MKKYILFIATGHFLFFTPLLNSAQEKNQKTRLGQNSVSSASLTICSGNQVVLSATPSGVGPFSYTWSPGGQTDSSITVSPTASSTFIVASSSFDGSSAGIDTIMVHVNPSPVVHLGPDTATCGCITLSAGSSGASYNWSTGDDYSTIHVCVSGIYWVTVSNGMCISSDTIKVTIHTPPVVNLGHDTSIKNSIILNAGNAGALFSWNTGASSQTISVNTTGQYYVTVTDTNGCKGSDTINVTADTFTLTIPEGFSPNGDQTNDHFVIRGIEHYPHNKFNIFNRWGDKIYESSPYKNEWDGKSTIGVRVGGDDLPVGTYFYLLDPGDGSSTIKGTIYLNR